MTSKMKFMASWFTVSGPVVRQNITVEVWMSKAAHVWNKTGSSSDHPTNKASPLSVVKCLSVSCGQCSIVGPASWRTSLQYRNRLWGLHHMKLKWILCVDMDFLSIIPCYVYENISKSEKNSKSAMLLVPRSLVRRSSTCIINRQRES